MAFFQKLCASWVMLVCGLGSGAGSVAGKDYFLTIGGGYAPEGNQASLERNVLFFQRVLSEKNLQGSPKDVFFADGQNNATDLQVMDQSSIPKPNRLMAEFFGSQEDLGLSYRDHQVPNVRGETSLKNIRDWFENTGSTMSRGDRLVLYVTSHGMASVTRSEPYNTSISLWNHSRITVRELVGLLDDLPEGVSVLTIMVQCHAGGFARFIYNEANPDKGFSLQKRAGFFATVHDRSAAGCTPEIDEATYVEYSTYFWEAISGFSRTGQAIEPPDYDKDGVVSFDEAHAYTILLSDTIDLPIKTSDEFLGDHARFQNERYSDLLPRELPFDQVIDLATPSEKAILEGLSRQLELGGLNRLEAAEERKAQIRARGRGRSRGRAEDTQAQLRRKIATDIESRWPAVTNLMNPLVIDLVTTQSEEFIRAIETHPDYQRYRGIIDNAPDVLSDQERQVKYERFVRTIENAILRENLMRMKDVEAIAFYKSMVDAESATLTSVD